jgi:ADP-heptose:LPS heptosyltransferase
VLIYRIGSLGDTIVALPCFHLVARAFPDSERILLTNIPVHAKAPAAPSVLGESGLIHGHLSYPIGTRSMIDLAKLCRQIRRLRVETMVYLTPPRGESAAKRDEWFFRLCGIKEIIGIPRGDLAVHRYDAVMKRYEAEASRLARCLAPIGDVRLSDPASWSLVFTQKERMSASSVLRPLQGGSFLSLAIGSKANVTDWGVENWKALMPRLHEEFPKHSLVFFGAKEDRSPSATVAARWPGNTLNVSGDLSARESAAVMQQSDLFIGMDSGPMHLAASVGIPCVAVFSARNRPGMWFPFGDAHEVIYHMTECFGCNLDTCTIEKKRCILSISVGEVVEAARRARDRRQGHTVKSSELFT